MGLHFSRLLPAISISAFRHLSTARFGDSIVWGAAGSDLAHEWAHIVSLAWGATTDYNAAISGTVLQNSNGSGAAPLTNNGRDRFAADLLGANKQEALIFAYGFNDARYTGAPSTFNVAQYTADFKEALNGLIAGGYTPSKIYIVSPYWISDTALATIGSAGFTGQTRGGFEAFVTAAHDVAAEYGTQYCDVYAAMRDGGAAALISADGLHPNDAGHALIAATVLASTRLKSTAAPTISLTSNAAGALNYVITPTQALVADYTVEYSVVGTYTYSGTTASADLAGSWTGLAYNYYRVRVRANFTDGTSSPWAFSSSVLDGSNVFLNDTFTDTEGTALTAHTPEIGGAWLTQTGYSPASPNLIDASNGVYSQTTSGVYRNTQASLSNDYYAEAVFIRHSLVASDNIGVMVAASASADTFYFVRYAHTNTRWELFRNSGGTNVEQTALRFTDSFAAGQTRTLRITLSTSGASTVLTVLIDGTQRMQYTDSNPIARPGHVGLRIAAATTSTTGLHCSSITASM
jgi:lysophospholipase L1-like esterase